MTTALYWNSKGAHQDKYDVLKELIPNAGECEAHRPKLDILRRSANAYYDIFNNGGCNRSEDILELFCINIDSDAWNDDEDNLDWDKLGERADAHMDTYILDAWAEHEEIKSVGYASIYSKWQNGVETLEPSADPRLERQLAYLFLEMADNAGALTNDSEWPNVFGFDEEQTELAMSVIVRLKEIPA